MRHLLLSLGIALLVVIGTGCDRRRAGGGIPDGGGGPMTDGSAPGVDGGTGGGVDGGDVDGGGSGFDGGGSGFDGGATTDDLTGSWTGTWSSLGVGGMASATLAQSGFTLIGAVTFEGSPCGTMSTLDGTVSGTSLAGDLTFDDGSVASVVATTDGTSTIEGSADITSGTCAGISATFSLSRGP